MVMLPKDGDFLEIQHELYLLEEYIDVLDSQLDALIQKENKEYDEKIKSESDESERDILRQDYYEYTESTLIKFFRYPVIVTLWAVFESGVNFTANYVREKEKIALELKDIRGDDFLDQSKKYFSHILQFPHFYNNDKKINELKILRNVIMHHNGQFKVIINKKNKKS